MKTTGQTESWRLESSRSAVPVGAPWSGRPVLQDQRVFLVSRGPRGKTHTLVQAQGLGTPEEGAWNHTKHYELDTAVEVGPLFQAPDRTLWLPYYEHPTALRLLKFRADGTVLSDEVLEREEPFVAQDREGRLSFSLFAAEGQDFGLSWCYRQEQEWRTVVRDGASMALRWRQPERALGVSGSCVVCAARPEDGERWRGRALRTGEVCWELDGRGWLLGALSDGLLVVVDRCAQWEAFRKLEPREGALEDQETGFRYARLRKPKGPAVVRVLNASTGEELRAVAVEGDVLDVTVGPWGLTVLSSAGAGPGVGRNYDAGGRLLGEFEVPGKQSAHWPGENASVRLIARTDDAVWWADEMKLHCVGPTGEAQASFALEENCAGLRALIGERSLPFVQATYEAPWLCLRGQERLYLYRCGA